ncbi:mannosyltransferase putative-domain-containing protein [Obelidium mucronatum]|nr:mannosyltransferase putative-domain-containing protein [Obelidium mucronatum]
MKVPRITPRRVFVAAIGAISLYFLLHKSTKIITNGSDSFLDSQASLLQLHVDTVLKGDGLRNQDHVVKGSRGIVFTGPGSFVDMTVMAVMLLRETGCTLPVEFAYLSNEVNQNQLDSLRNHNITPRDFLTTEIKSYNWDKEQLRLGAPKIDAILSSPFEQLLYLDPDVMPLRDPTYLFETKQFLQKDGDGGSGGALFWPDYNPTHPQNPIWKLTSQPYEFEFEFETGQVVLDKSRLSVQRGLSIAQYFCKHANVYFRYIWGDKDAFRWGFKMAKAGYFLNHNQLVSVGVGVGLLWNRRGGVSLRRNQAKMPTTAATIPPVYQQLEYFGGALSGWIGTSRYCGQNMLQLDFNDTISLDYAPTPLFLHANGIKKFYYDNVPPFQIAELYVLPKGKTLTELGKGGYVWIGKMRDQGHCGRLRPVDGLKIGHFDFATAYPGTNERYMKARRIAMGK